MIGKIKGKVINLDKNIALIETAAGISFNVYITPSLIARVSPTASTLSIEIFTYLQVREDAMVLFGFETKKELDFFNLLLTVPGVGPKTAFNVISFAKINEMERAVKENNIDYFLRIPGLGRKTSMKIILELSQRLKQEFSLEKMYLSPEDKTVIEALMSLGFRSHEAKALFSKLNKKLSIEEKIKQALQIGSSRKKTVYPSA